MKDDPMAKSVFKEIENQNPAVAHAFRAFRARSQPVEFSKDYAERVLEMPEMVHAYRSVLNHVMYDGGPVSRLRRRWPIYIAVALLAAGLVALGIVVGPILVRFMLHKWKYILLPTGGLCLGAGAVLLVGRIGASPLRTVDPPDEDAEDPLQELRDLAERTASRLRSAYNLQLWIVLAVGTVFITVIVWSMVMVSQKRILYASAFGSGGVAMVILTQWKWQPFDRINQARRLADNADTLATGLRLRMKTISEIKDPAERARAQWNAVSEYIDRS